MYFCFAGLRTGGPVGRASRRRRPVVRADRRIDLGGKLGKEFVAAETRPGRGRRAARRGSGRAGRRRTDTRRIRRSGSSRSARRTREANSRILKGVKEQVQRGRAGARPASASSAPPSALGKTVRQIAAVPQPSADAAKLTKWIGYLKQREDLPAEDRQGAEGARTSTRRRSWRCELNQQQQQRQQHGDQLRLPRCRIDSSRFI